MRSETILKERFRYAAEQSISLNLSYATLIDVSKFGEALENAPELKFARLYVILRRQRLRLATIDHRDSLVHLCLENSTGDRITFALSLEDEFQVEVEEGGLFIAIRSAEEALFSGKVSLLLTQQNAPNMQRSREERMSSPSVDETFLDLEVLYVGKSDSEKGVTNQRLPSHSMLQQILADHIDHAPDFEIWAMPLVFDGFETMTVIHGKDAERDISDAADVAAAGILASFDVNTLTALAEASLIRYFAPVYNTHYKSTFPSRKHKTYSAVFPFDFNAIGCSIDSLSTIGCRLWSEDVDPEFSHRISYPIDPNALRRPLHTADQILDLYDVAPLHETGTQGEAAID